VAIGLDIITGEGKDEVVKGLVQLLREISDEISVIQRIKEKDPTK
jgi:hypothetical protein